MALVRVRRAGVRRRRKVERGEEESILDGLVGELDCLVSVVCVWVIWRYSAVHACESRLRAFYVRPSLGARV